jgi:hypothetical protein
MDTIWEHPDRTRFFAVIKHDLQPLSTTLEQLAEFSDVEAGVLYDTCHCICIDRVVAGNRKEALTVRHDNVSFFLGEQL